MKKIGILTCSNTTQGLDCCSAGCMQSFNQNKGAFGAYQGEETEVVGVINCAGCPTTVAPKKILKRLGVLNEIGADTLHMSSCMTLLCPFKNKYRTVIQEAFPNLTIVEGTEAPEGVPMDEAALIFKTGVSSLLEETPRNMVELYRMIGQSQKHTGTSEA